MKRIDIDACRKAAEKNGLKFCKRSYLAGNPPFSDLKCCVLTAQSIAEGLPIKSITESNNQERKIFDFLSREGFDRDYMRGIVTGFDGKQKYQKDENYLMGCNDGAEARREFFPD